MKYSHLCGIRTLDMDDLLIIDEYANGHTATKICKMVGLTPPAICHRFKKYQALFGNIYVLRGENNYRVRFNNQGFKLAGYVHKALLSIKALKKFEQDNVFIKNESVQ